MVIRLLRSDLPFVDSTAAGFGADAILRKRMFGKLAM